MKHIVTAALLGLALLGTPALAQDETLTGTARAIDADILQFDGVNKRVILFGVDAPDRDQFCELGNERFACYEAAIRGLETMATRGEVTCTLTDDRDPLGRRYGRCTVDGLDINAEMVKQGLAFAFILQSKDYVPAQEEAEAAAVGVFQPDMEFTLPWVARAKKGAGIR